MESIHYNAGALAAKRGEFRAAPANLKIVTTPWHEWYAGYDAATRGDGNAKLSTSFSLRTASPVREVSL